MARQPNSQTYELGHWESAQIAVGIDLAVEELIKASRMLSTNQEMANNAEQIDALQDLQRIFNSGTHTVIHKLEEQ